MKWITRERVKVDRVACPWLIKKFIDPDATFLFVPTDEVMAVAEREHAVPYDVKDVELGHHGKECSFDAIVKKYNLDGDPAMALLAKIVNGADTDNSLWNQPEAAGLNAVAEGFRHMGYKNDHEVNAAQWIVYDALYAYCKEMIRRGKPNGTYRLCAKFSTGGGPHAAVTFIAGMPGRSTKSRRCRCRAAPASPRTRTATLWCSSPRPGSSTWRRRTTPASNS